MLSRDVGGARRRDAIRQLRAVAFQRAVLDQAADDLLDEQRVAAGALEDARRAAPAGERPARRTEPRAALGSSGLQGRQPDAMWLVRLVASAPASNAGRWVSTSISRRALEPVGRARRKRLERGGIGPMQVFDDDKQRATAPGAARRWCGPRSGSAACSCSGSTWLLPGVDGRRGRAHGRGSGMSSAPSDGDSPSSASRPPASPASPRHYPSARCRRRCAGSRRSRRRCCSPSGEQAVRRTTTRAEPLIVLDPRQEFAHQARLADAGIADQAHHMGVAARPPVPGNRACG